MNKALVVVVIFAVVLLGGFMLMNSQRTSVQTTNEDAMMEDKDNTVAEEGDGAIMEEEATEKAEVTIENYAFSPKTIKVKVGGTVTWTNNDSVAHTATGDSDEFDTGLISQGQSKSVTFDEAGTFTYHCTPHPNMKATVVVE